MTTPSLMQTILGPGGLSARFQPIVDLDEVGAPSLHAAECLTRGPRGTNVEDALVLFEYVRRKREEGSVDRACVTGGLEAGRCLAGAPILSLNVHAVTHFLDQEADRCEIELDRLTIELVGSPPNWSHPGITSALEGLRHRGVRIALDDVGLGTANCHAILECRPDFFKLDRYFVHGVHNDFARQAVVEAVTMLAADLEAQVVAEGLEEPADLEFLRGLGIRLAQGHLFSPAVPAAEWANVTASFCRHEGRRSDA
jgi:EAL domain-containing protein (putative c-di-GMP-specific phosphodiesterase class I)